MGVAPRPAADLPTKPAIDPYLLWRIVRLLAAQQQGDIDLLPAYVSVLAEFRDPHEWLDGFIPTHTNSIVEGEMRPRFRSGIIPWGKLSSIYNDKSNVARVELAWPRDGSSVNRKSSAPAQAVGATEGFDALTDEALNSLLKRKGVVPEMKVAATGAASASRRCPLVSVIDDRCNFAGHGITDLFVAGDDSNAAGRPSRTPYFGPALTWGLRPMPAPLLPTITVAGAVLGLRLDAMGTAGASSNVRPPRALDFDNEPETYRLTEFMRATSHASHGSAVLDLIANARLRIGDRLVRRVTVPPSAIRLVQLPVPTVLDTAGGSLGAYVLDAIHDVLQRASAGQEVIVNLSFGTHSGPHDGTSMFESALCELLCLYDGSERAAFRRLHVVLPAGNSHLWRCHAQGVNHAGGPSTTLGWKVLPDDDTDNYVEIWVPHGQTLTVTVTPPGFSPETVTIGKDDWNPKFFGTGWSAADAAGMLCCRQVVPQATNSSMVLLAVAPNALPKALVEALATDLLGQSFDETKAFMASKFKAVPPHRTFAPHGVWRVELSVESGTANWHAWIQRGDTAPLRGRSRRGVVGRQSHFLQLDEDSRPDPRVTLNGIATAKHDRLYVVGSLRRSDGGISDYSAAGPVREVPTRTCGPDWVVAADESRNRPGLLVGGVLRGARQRLAGTSAAAAVFTRYLYECLSAGRDPASGLVAGAPPSTRIPTIAEGAPEHSDPFFRGETRRYVPDGERGWL